MCKTSSNTMNKSQSAASSREFLQSTEYHGKVVNRRPMNHEVLLIMDDSSQIKMHRYVPAGPSDLLARYKGNYWVLMQEQSPPIRLTPPWSCGTTLSIGPHKVKLTIKEIESEHDLEGYKRLTEYHYRGAGGIGRSVPLIAKMNTWELPSVVGFIELSSSFIVNSARKNVFNSPFSDPDSGVAWIRWDTQTAKKYINNFVRISRCVVFPELRGIGLSKKLVEAAIKYSIERWHIAGKRPIFIEITADMLRYWPFVKKCGFKYIGETEGNEHRAVKDMKYLLQRSAGTNGKKGFPHGGGGIMTLQRSYASLLDDVMRRKHLSIEQIIAYLRKDPEKLTDEEWVLFHKVYRRPKPTYVYGLTEAASKFIERRVGLVKRPQTYSIPALKNSTDKEILDIDNLSILIKARPISSSRARKVQEAFGIVSTEFELPLVTDLCITASRGEIILVSGPSGTGKSVLLRSIRWLSAKGRRRGRIPNEIEINGISKLSRIGVSSIKPVTNGTAPIDLLGRLDLEESIRILAFAGLAEPHLFVRPAGHLSLGQQYRLSLAVALSERPDLLLIDEFCELLDRFSTIVVCRRLRSAVKNFGFAAIVATSYPQKVIDYLQPNRTLFLSSTSEHRWENPKCR